MKELPRTDMQWGTGHVELEGSSVPDSNLMEDDSTLSQHVRLDGYLLEVLP